jgi:FKBP-type peptidyl-prolyl cis-trans isomerase FklB
MYRSFITALLAGLFVWVTTAQDGPALKSQKDKLSYALGMDLGNQLRKQSVDVDPALFGKGLAEALSGSKTLLTAEEARAAIATLQAELKQKQTQAAKAAAEENKKAGEAFLAENKKKEGVVSLPSGLQYKILKAGDGKKPAEADTVLCHYRGTLIDGREFDSSYKRSQPAAFAVKGVIAGLREALQLMPVGSKWQLFIPSSLAYSDRGGGNRFGPNAALVFELELISIKGTP